jgi:hypothetical protein
MNRKDVVTAGVMINEYDRLTDLLRHLDQGAEIELMTNGGESLDIGYVKGIREGVRESIQAAKIMIAVDLDDIGVSLEEDEPQLPIGGYAPAAIPPSQPSDPVPPWPASVPHGPTCNCGSCQDREEQAGAMAKRFGLQVNPKT